MVCGWPGSGDTEWSWERLFLHNTVTVILCEACSPITSYSNLGTFARRALQKPSRSPEGTATTSWATNRRPHYPGHFRGAWAGCSASASSRACSAISHTRTRHRPGQAVCPLLQGSSLWVSVCAHLTCSLEDGPLWISP